MVVCNKRKSLLTLQLQLLKVNFLLNNSPIFDSTLHTFVSYTMLCFNYSSYAKVCLLGFLFHKAGVCITNTFKQGLYSNSMGVWSLMRKPQKRKKEKSFSFYCAMCHDQGRSYMGAKVSWAQPGNSKAHPQIDFF